MKSIILHVTVIFSVLLFSGCQSVRVPKGIKPVSAQGVIDRNGSIYVPIGVDGHYFSFPARTQKLAKDSGAQAAAVLFSGLQRYQPRTVMGTGVENEHQALASARDKGLKYVVYSRVNDWTDASYLTCSAAYVDSVNVDVSIYEVASGEVVRLDKIYNGGCPTRIFSIPFGTSSPAGRFKSILDVWLRENFREVR